MQTAHSQRASAAQNCARVAVAGASGYAGGEVLRLLSAHPSVEIGALTAHSAAGQRLSVVQPHLRLGTDRELESTTAQALAGHDAVILALPHGQSGALAAEIETTSPETLLIDLGADHRLESAEDWAEYYGTEHAGTWTYGMPELPLASGGSQRDLLRGATRIAVPGCNATAVTLALTPLIAAGAIVPQTLQAVLPVGYTGAGRAPKQHLMLSEAHGGARAYAVGGSHRHIPEILQNIRRATGVEDALLTFTPVLVPMSRGILAVCSAAAVGPKQTGDLLEILHAAYDAEPIIDVLPEGQMPDTAHVRGANTVRIGAVMDRRSGQATVVCALDNLMKGTAGAAVQCLNLALGVDEGTGLPRTGLAP